LIALSRRAFVAGLAGLGVSAVGLVVVNGCGPLPFAARPVKGARVGFVGDTPYESWVEPLWDGLREQGWIEGQNLIVERRTAPVVEQQLQEAVPALVAELVALPVDVLVTGGTPTTIAAKRATDTLPIVFVNLRDPVGVGVVSSLARPGGNVTGVSQGASTPLSGKQLELLRAAVPGLTHVAVIADAINPSVNALTLAEIEQAAVVLGVHVQELEVGSADDLEGAFATAARWPADGVLLRQSGLLLSQRTRIAALAAGLHLPAMYQSTEFVAAGGLMSYGTSQRATFRRAASLVDKLLRGARPGDLPVEQLTAVEFAINVSAAEALGLTMPPDVAAQVTEWIT
jgi:putative ABC transport system substrate-binding protein